MTWCLLFAAETDLDRRRVKVKRAEAKLPTSVNDLLTQMNCGLGIQQASPEMEAKDERFTGDYDSQMNMLRKYQAQIDSELAQSSSTPPGQDIKRPRRPESTN